jgi:intracellular septation protein
MKILFDLFPVILFFATYKFFSNGKEGNACLSDQAASLSWTQEPILLATVAAIIATFVQVAWVKYRHGKVDAMLWMSFSVITVFGGATLYFHNPIFIQWKPTILYWTFAMVFAIAPLIAGRNPIRSMLESQVHLPNHVWRNLNSAYALFFFGLGIANVAAIHWLSCDSWVNFKVFGLSGLIFVFILAQTAVLSKYFEKDQERN